MTAADWVRIVTLIGNAILFYASFRNQRWARTQAIIEAQAWTAAKSSEGTESTANSKTSDVAPSDVDRLAALFASRPYFDHTAYRLLCTGFAITAAAALLDIWISGTLSRLITPP